MKLIPTIAQACFLLAFLSFLYGLALWSRPLAFVVGGLIVMAVSFLVNYRTDTTRSAR